MAHLTNEAIMTKLVEIIEDLTQDWGLSPDLGISGKTSLVNDMEFASVDIIQLCVAIEQHYERKIGFQDLLMKDGSYVSDLSVSQLTQYLKSKL